MQKDKIVEVEIGGKKLILKTGKLAGQASGAVLAQLGDTVVLSAVVASPLKIDLGYFPLTVEYQERLYAGGRIKGSRWVKREGRATDEEILSARLIDRSIRPLFPSEYKKEVQVIVTVLSVDLENDPTVLGSIATSASLAISNIPWLGPIGTLKVGLKSGNFLINPISSELKDSEMDLVVSSTKDAVVMIEGGIKEVPEEKVGEAITLAKNENDKIVDAIEKLVKEIGKDKEPLPKTESNTELLKKVQKLLPDKKLKEIVSDLAVHEGGDSYTNELKKAIIDELPEEDPVKISEIFENLLHKKTREIILNGDRPDGRKPREIRKISAEVSVLPRTHGSGLFQRGQTQVLTIATLGPRSLGQLIETAEGEEEKNYIHHYSMPPFATGEAGRFTGPSRREIGHGALAERALLAVIPDETTFPYAIRVVSEVMSSNGSTSMGSTCGSTLALMDAGVPIKAPVSGIAMGVVVENSKKYAILSDIVGFEDHHGDMDFKVAGTEKGITALQLDVKSLLLTDKILSEALIQAKDARLEILNVMLKAIDKPNKNVSAFAPKIEILTIPVEMIGEFIGPSGKNIKKLIAETGTQIEVEDSGKVYVSSTNETSVTKAAEYIKNMTKIPQSGEIYQGEVKKVLDFGAFVEILPGKEGMVHVSDMAEGYVENANDVVKEGDRVQVRVKEIDKMGRLNLSMRMDPSTDKERTPRERNGRGNFGGRGGGFGGRRNGGDRGRSDRGGDRSSQNRRSGPHFPTSRFVKDNPRSGGSKRFGR
ncbi:MAG: polyribonucleotide nucleotidyltransferase [Candidatus Woesebacteria bacterium]|nr:MAG: polyribonucleotide nucleotidyltransferase [Candidatus Woesebacteria bacterium]